MAILVFKLAAASHTALLTCVVISIKTPESCAGLQLWAHIWGIHTQRHVEFSDLRFQLDT